MAFELRYLYLGSNDVARDLEWYLEVLGARKVWDFADFGTRVAAVDIGGPLVLLAGHRPAGTILPVYATSDLDATLAGLRARGFTCSDRFGIPDGDCVLWKDQSGNEFALFGDERPRALEALYRDPRHEHAVRNTTEPTRPLAT